MPTVFTPLTSGLTSQMAFKNFDSAQAKVRWDKPVSHSEYPSWMKTFFSHGQDSPEFKSAFSTAKMENGVGPGGLPKFQAVEPEVIQRDLHYNTATGPKKSVSFSSSPDTLIEGENIERTNYKKNPMAGYKDVEISNLFDERSANMSARDKADAMHREVSSAEFHKPSSADDFWPNPRDVDEELQAFEDKQTEANIAAVLDHYGSL
ncbi:hypothetical protein FHS85_003452 [Rhodoligotrophos appendicifer]|uniref:hypothetical protein n=1 Tax=Rhodoligotrophos appendicifer TaxID=987056 RepID=UPI0011847434|nr:hypothetical protein [Rhodoligotrophos appendicifer]